jgi:hypothetical protein
VSGRPARGGQRGRVAGVPCTGRKLRPSSVRNEGAQAGAARPGRRRPPRPAGGPGRGCAMALSLERPAPIPRAPRPQTPPGEPQAGRADLRRRTSIRCRRRTSAAVASARRSCEPPPAAWARAPMPPQTRHVDPRGPVMGGRGPWAAGRAVPARAWPARPAADLGRGRAGAASPAAPRLRSPAPGPSGASREAAAGTERINGNHYDGAGRRVSGAVGGNRRSRKGQEARGPPAAAIRSGPCQPRVRRRSDQRHGLPAGRRRFKGARRHVGRRR